MSVVSVNVMKSDLGEGYGNISVVVDNTETILYNVKQDDILEILNDLEHDVGIQLKELLNLDFENKIAIKEGWDG